MYFYMIGKIEKSKLELTIELILSLSQCIIINGVLKSLRRSRYKINSRVIYLNKQKFIKLLLY